MYRNSLTIFVVVVPDQTVSGIEFDTDDLRTFVEDVSTAYGTSTDRIVVQSVELLSESLSSFKADATSQLSRRSSAGSPASIHGNATDVQLFQDTQSPADRSDLSGAAARAETAVRVDLHILAKAPGTVLARLFFCGAIVKRGFETL